MLAAPGASVVSESAVEEYGDQFGQNVVSAGPFKLEEWEQNLQITMTAFEDYWDGRPYLDSLKFKFIHDENTRVVELLTGNLDWAWVTPAHHNALTTNNKYKDHIGRVNTLHAAYFIINMENGPFGNNEKLRKAMSYALDTQAVIDSLQGRADPAVGFFPPGFMGRNPEAPAYEHNVEKAKELMAEAGYPDGMDETYTLVSLPWENLINILSIYQQNLKEIGINIELNPVQFGQYTSIIQEGDFDLAYGYKVPDYADADGFAYPLLHSEASGNAANYSNSEVDELIEEGRQATSEEARTEIYEEITSILQEELPYITTTHNIWVDVTDPSVRNWQPSAMDIHMFHKVWMEQ
jgi:ABC-type transport system substrate-binding protein